MKKILLLLISFATFGITKAQKVGFGLKGGLSISSFKAESKESSSKTGFHGGGFYEIKLGQKISLQPELLFSMKGGKLDPQTTGFTEATYSFSYLSIPVLISFKPTPQFYIQAGPEIGFLLSVKAEFESGPTNNLTQLYETIDKGLILGGGYNLKNGLGFYARYGAGFKGFQEVNVVDNNGTIIRREKVGAHTVFQVGIQYSFYK